jgi:hypothetical protein
MAADRAGLRGYTVPAVETRLIGKMPDLMARETAAFWAYWVRP